MIGWKQVCNSSIVLCLAYFKLDLCRFEGVQEIAIHIRLYVVYLSPLRRG
jgi:hypothetical protein